MLDWHHTSTHNSISNTTSLDKNKTFKTYNGVLHGAFAMVILVSLYIIELWVTDMAMGLDLSTLPNNYSNLINIATLASSLHIMQAYWCDYSMLKL